MSHAPRSTLLIIWSSMCTSIVLFFVIAVVVGADAQVDPVDPVVIGGLLLAGVGQSLFALVGAPLVFRSQVAQSAYIIRFALMEGAAVFGLVVHMLGASLPGAALMGWALFGQMLQVPTPGRVEAWEAARLGDRA